MDEDMGDMDLGDMDLIGLEDGCKNNALQNITLTKIDLPTDLLHMAKSNNNLGVVSTTLK